MERYHGTVVLVPYFANTVSGAARRQLTTTIRYIVATAGVSSPGTISVEKDGKWEQETGRANTGKGSGDRLHNGVSAKRVLSLILGILRSSSNSDLLEVSTLPAGRLGTRQYARPRNGVRG
jgi:hypothetical protein